MVEFTDTQTQISAQLCPSPLLLAACGRVGSCPSPIAHGPWSMDRRSCALTCPHLTRDFRQCGHARRVCAFSWRILGSGEQAPRCTPGLHGSGLVARLGGLGTWLIRNSAQSFTVITTIRSPGSEFREQSHRQGARCRTLMLVEDVDALDSTTRRDVRNPGTKVTGSGLVVTQALRPPASSLAWSSIMTRFMSSVRILLG